MFHLRSVAVHLLPAAPVTSGPAVFVTRWPLHRIIYTEQDSISHLFMKVMPLYFYDVEKRMQ